MPKYKSSTEANLHSELAHHGWHLRRAAVGTAKSYHEALWVIRVSSALLGIYQERKDLDNPHAHIARQARLLAWERLQQTVFHQIEEAEKNNA